MIVPIFNTVVVPEANIYLQTDSYKKMTEKDPVIGERIVFLVVKESKERKDMTVEDFYRIGVSGSIVEINPNGYIVVKTAGRVNIDEIMISSNHNIELTVSRRKDILDLDPLLEKEHFERLKGAMMDFSQNFQWGQMANFYINRFASISEIVAALSMWMPNSNEEKYAILAEDSKAGRMALMEKMIYEYLEITKVTNDAASAQEEDYQKLYREQAIKKQIAYLQQELEAMNPDTMSDLQRFEMKINAADMNEAAEKEARKVLNRLKQEGQNSQESGMLYDYLDFVTGLSWKKEKAEEIDLEEARKVLDEEHFGLKKVKERIIQQIAVMNLQKKQSGSILLFVGAPGTGKTSIGKSIAKSLKREYVRVSLGGVKDEADIRGHRRTYIGAMPGRIMDGISKSKVSNPVMVLDEVDKLSNSYNGDPASALLEVLDPEQNNSFTDHYMNMPYDLSDVMFICTANSTDTIPEPLLNRMEVIQFPGYTATDKLQIAKRHLLKRAMDGCGIKEGQLSISDATMETIISDYTMEAGVRGLKKRIDTLCRAAAVQIVENPDARLMVEDKDLREYLDMRPISHEHVLVEKKAGIVTGLAWTAAGGEILFIESLFTAGSGKIIITGQLGDVMKESVQIAVSLVKSMFPEMAETFEKNDLHVHVPAGAVPKDGPSAGITLTTAIASLLTGKAVGPEFAMTGEVSLRGVVTPIGGLPEKLMAAQRAGISTVFIPKENEDDLREVPDEVKNKLEIIPVDHVTEVLEKTGIL